MENPSMNVCPVGYLSFQNSWKKMDQLKERNSTENSSFGHEISD